MRPEVPLEGDVGAADRGSETGPVAGPRQRTDICSRPAAGREGGKSRRERSDRGSAEGEESLLISDAQRLMSTVLTALIVSRRLELCFWDYASRHIFQSVNNLQYFIIFRDFSQFRTDLFVKSENFLNFEVA